MFYRMQYALRDVEERKAPQHLHQALLPTKSPILKMWYNDLLLYHFSGYHVV